MQNLMLTLYSRYSKQFRFLIAGGLNTIVGLSIYPLFYIFLEPLGFGYIQVLLFSQMFCITFSFFTNKYFVFKTKGNVKEEYLRFFAFYGFYLLLNLLCLSLIHI